MEFEIWVYILLFVVGVFSGFVDSIAGGGGLITIPALLAVGIPEHVALATNKLQSTFGSFSASYNFAKKGFIKFSELLSGIIWTFVGAIFGTISVLLIDPQIIKILIPLMLVGIFLYTIFSPNIGEFEKEKKMSQKSFYVVFGLIIGFYDGFLGPGTGSFWMFAMIALIGLEMKKAVAHTKALNFTSNIVSLVVFILGGQILWIIGFIMGFGQLLGAYIGSTMVVKKEIKFIKTIFLFVVGCTILKLIYDLIK
nr:TSUP family transporter [Campylobacter sp.]